MFENNEEMLMALTKENKELKYRVDELRKNFLTLKVEMEIQQDHIKRVLDLNKLLLPNLDIENIASSFFNYLKDVLGYDQCGIIVKNRKYFFLNDSVQNQLILQKNIDNDKEVEQIFDYLYMELENTRKPVILETEKVQEISNHQLSSLVALPLINHSELLGLIVLESKQENVYTKNELDLIIELTEFMPEIIENALHFSKVNQVVIKDSITGLYNRDFFDTHIENKFINKNRTFSVIFMDILKLKRVNSLYGNSAGDTALKELSKILKIFSHKKYLVSRYEGGKFSILLPNYSLENSEKIAEKIRDYLIKKNILKLNLDYSFGIARFEENSNLTKDEILKNADNALYTAKLLGENKIVSYKLSNN